MSRSAIRLTLFSLFSCAAVALMAPGPARADTTPADAERTIAHAKQLDPSIAHMFKDSAGYVVFPGIGKGGFVVGGAHGNGIVYEKGKEVGKASLTQVSVGAQAGGQQYAEIIFFETPAKLDAFKRDGANFSAQTSAVALKSGASANAKYTDGVSVITFSESGLMAEASVGGQKIKYEPLPSSPK